MDIRQRVEDFPYELGDKVGEGAMGEVYRAHEALLDRTVALKFLRRDYLAGHDTDHARMAARRFLQEARAAARLNHPAVATIYRVGIYRKLPYIAMEWLGCETLEQRVASGRVPLSMDEICELGLSLLDVLAAAHRAGIVHRDIKPANLFLNEDGRLRITDFGIARMQESNLVKTRTGLVLGTPMYAAPEQLRGQLVDARCDLYAVGAVLYELLCGRPPHEAHSLPELFGAVLHGQVEPLRRHNTRIHAALEKVVLRALEKEPERRFTSARAMHEALRNATAAVRAPVTPATPRRAVDTDTDAARGEAGWERRASSGAACRAPDRRGAGSPGERDASAPAQGGSTAGGLPQRRSGEIPASDAVAAMLGRRGRSLVVPGETPGAVISELVRRWPSRDLAVQDWRALLEQLLARPPHVEAFAGGVRLGDVLLLLWDGLVLAALDTRTGVRGDAALEQLPMYVPATLHLCPRHVAERRRVVKHLAALVNSSVRERRTLPRGASLGRFGTELTRGRFDGVLRLHHVQGTAYVVYSYGRCVLELYPPSWPRGLRDGGWQHAETSQIAASAETMQLDLPDCTWRRELADLTFQVDGQGYGRRVRLGADELFVSGPRGPSRRAILRARHERDPVFEVQRWMLDELPRWCSSEPERARRWPSLVERLERVREIRWHHAPLLELGARTPRFDLVTLGDGGQLFHLVDRVASGSTRALEDFVERAHAVREANERGRALGGVLLVAPTFEPDAVERYHDLTAQRLPGLELLLVEHQPGSLRPLVA